MSIELAERTWGPHPANWPRPPLKRPRFWQRQSVKKIRELEAVFGRLSNESLQRYYEEAERGQSVYEDCGGYFLRCYRAMIGESVIVPYTYQQALEDAARRVS